MASTERQRDAKWRYQRGANSARRRSRRSRAGRKHGLGRARHHGRLDRADTRRPRRDGSRHRLHARPRQGDRWSRHRLVRRPLSRGDARLPPRTRLVGPRLADRRHGALDDLALAVVYAVLVERDLSDTRIGKLLMSATFVTDLCTALALSAIFVKPNGWFPAFLVVSLTLILVL